MHPGKNITNLICIFLLAATGRLTAVFPDYPSNPFAFSVAEPPYYGTFFAADLNNDGLLDFTFRSVTTLYAYDHWGALMWQVPLAYPCPEINNHGTKHGAADVDGDGRVEVVALDNDANVYILDGETGTVKQIYPLPPLGTDQLACHIAVVNLRGMGDRDAVIQTCDISPELHGWNENAMGYYLNRSLIAMNLETGTVLWRVDQDADPSNGIYEGYWGPAHGSFFAADVDGDGLDEVIGGNLIRADGTVVDLGYPRDWIDIDAPRSYIDHLDGISVGDIRPDLPGLEWVVTNEDNTGNTHHHTSLMNTDGIIWSHQISAAIPQAKEPQQIAVGNYDPANPFPEIWARSRLGGQGDQFYRPYDSQWAWLYDAQGNLYDRVTTYRMVERLPRGFNSHPTEGNKLGIEIPWTIDWDGSPKEYIAGKARYVDGHIGILDVWKTSYQYKLDTVWTTMNRRPNMKAQMLYVADVAGDGREEMIVYDASDGKIRIYANTKPNPHQPKPHKWDDPLYRRLKQNWNYYSPGGYTYTNYPLIADIQISDITASGATISWTTDVPSTSRIAYGPTDRLGGLTEENTALTTAHTILIDSLEKNTPYKIQIHCRNQYGKLGISHIRDLDLLELPPVDLTRISAASQGQVQLTWGEIQDISLFNVYRDTTTGFFPGDANRIGNRIADADPGQTGVQWTDTGEGPPVRFYKVTAASGIHEGDPSEALGVYTYPIVTTEGTDFNLIGLSLETTGLPRASDLMARIPGCNSVARWDASQQGFEQYVPGIPATNFDIQSGQAYYINATLDTAWTLTGRPVRPVYTLIATATSSFNPILLPLYRTDIRTASALAADIPGCNGVARWDAASQAYTDQYDPAVPATDFPVRPGQPYLVNVTANTTWPEHATPKSMPGRKDIAAPAVSHAPHLVWGLLDPSSPAAAFRAYFSDRPGRILTETSPGCGIREGRWQVQCGNFRDGWHPGKVLVVEFLSPEGRILGRIETALSSNPSDRHEAPEAGRGMEHPVSTSLGRSHPNPFNPATTVPYALEREGPVSIRIFNLQGRLVRTLVNRWETAGFREVVWDGTDRSNHPVSGGVYLVSMQAGYFRATQKILLLK